MDLLPTRQGSRVIAALALAATLAIGGCGDATEDEKPPGFQRLELRPVQPELIQRRIRTAAQLAVPTPIESWSLEGGELSLAPEEEGESTRLLIQGPQLKRLRIPGPFDPTSFDLVVTRLSTWTEHRLSAQLVREGWGSIVAEPRRIKAQREPQTVVFEFKKLEGQSDPFDELVLSFDGPGLVVLHQGVDLIERPPAALLPDPNAALELVQVGDEWRRATTLTEGAPSRARARVPEHAWIELAYGLPAGLERQGGGHVRVRVEADGVRPEEFELEAPGRTPNGWRSARFDLAAFGDTEAIFTFELDTPGDGRALCALTQPLVFAFEAQAQTVLLVTSDTHRADHIGAAKGSVDVRTPNLDALAASGVLFEDCFTATNVTNPSHIALMTATSPRDTGIVNNFSALAEAAPTLAEHFARAGYATYAATSAPHLGHPTSGLGQGFDRMSFPRRDRDGEITIAALRRWLLDAEGQPLFVWLHLFDAHTPYDAPDSWTDGYWPEGRDAFDPTLPTEDLPDMDWPPSLRGLRDLEYPLALYRGEVSYLDDQLGRLFAVPRFSAGIIGLTADHGESFGEHGIYYGHEGLYPEAIHVPLILSWPGAPAGRRVTEPVRQIDLSPTLLELAGLPLEGFPGASLLPFVEGEGITAPRFALAAHEHAASINSDGWHLVLHLREHAPVYGTSLFEKHACELYDLHADPKCELDRSADEPERARRMRESLVRWLTTAPETNWKDRVSQDAELHAELDKLGYSTSDESGESTELFDADCSCEECAKY